MEKEQELTWWRCPECTKEKSSTFLSPFCGCEPGVVMLPIEPPEEVAAEEKPLPKVIQMNDHGDRVLLDDGTMWRWTRGSQQWEWELIEGPPCTRPEEKKDALPVPVPKV